MSHTISVFTTMDGPGFHDFAVFDAFHHRKAWLRPAIFAAIMLAFAAVCLSLLSKRPGAGRYRHRRMAVRPAGQARTHQPPRMGQFLLRLPHRQRCVPLRGKRKGLLTE